MPCNYWKDAAILCFLLFHYLKFIIPAKSSTMAAGGTCSVVFGTSVLSTSAIRVTIGM